MWTSDNKAIISTNADHCTVLFFLQSHYSINGRMIQKMVVKQSKSTRITFPLKLTPCPAVTLSGTQIPSCPTVKYLGLILDCQFTWVDHIWAIKLQLNFWLCMFKTLNKIKHIIHIIKYQINHLQISLKTYMDLSTYGL